MRKSHIDYIRAMAESVSIDSQNLFAPEPGKRQGKFLETYPSIDLFQRILPICVVNSVRVNDNLDGRYTLENRRKLSDRLPTRTNPDGSKTFRTLVEEFKQEFRYVLHFIIKDPTRDLLSEIESPGILDQCKFYISQNPKFQAKAISDSEVFYNVYVDVVTSEHITQYAADGIYILSLEILFRDKLFTIKEEPALSGTLQIEQPIKLENL